MPFATFPYLQKDVPAVLASGGVGSIHTALFKLHEWFLQINTQFCLVKWKTKMDKKNSFPMNSFNSVGLVLGLMFSEDK